MKARFLEIAMRESEKSTYDHKLGAVLYKKNRVLSIGYNKPNKTHPKSTTQFKTQHAEFDAIMGLSREDLHGATLLVVRNAKSGTRMAKPCKCCMSLIEKVGIKKVIFSTNEGFEELIVNG